MKHAFSTFLCGIALLAVAGCAAPRVSSLPPDSASLWRGFQEISRPDGRNHISGSLRSGPEQDTRRVTFNLWSVNDPSQPVPPIRMEIFAGAGARVCSALFTRESMLVLMHQEKTAWTGNASKESLEKLLGAKLPLPVDRLFEFVCGSYYSALGSPEPSGAEPNGKGNAVFRFSGKTPVSSLELGPDARPVHASLSGGEWELDIRCGDDLLPSRLSGRVKADGADHRFVLLAKERSRTEAAGADLAIPPGYRIFFTDSNL